jgi:hypothetical protein
MTQHTDNPLPDIGEFIELLRNRNIRISKKLGMCKRMREQGSFSTGAVDRILFLELARCLEQIGSLEGAVEELGSHCKGLKVIVDKLSEPPWRPAIFMGKLETERGLLARVFNGGGERLVPIAESLNDTVLKSGDRVLLASEMNRVVALAPGNAMRTGESATVKRCLPDQRLVIDDHGTDYVIERGDDLCNITINRSDQVRWDRHALLGLEKLEPESSPGQLLVAVGEDTGTTALGGYDELQDTAIRLFVMGYVSPALASDYGIDQRNNTLLLHGPQGCGKTRLARRIASEISNARGVECRLSVVAGSQLFSPWVGQTEANIRREFKQLSDYPGPALLFLDEIDSIGVTRGTDNANSHADRFLGTLLAEMQGANGKPDLAVIATTNRADVLDAALRDRFGAEIYVPRPNREAAGKIFDVHLPTDLRYQPNGSTANVTRAELIATAVSMMYDPNNDNEVARLQFRDGTKRVVSARELLSGRLIEQCCISTREAAFYRHADNGEAGICLDDMQTAITALIDRLGQTLTRRNAHNYLHDLPQDLDVVSVEPIRHQVYSHRFLQ